MSLYLIFKPVIISEERKKAMSKGYNGCDHCPELTGRKKCGLEISLAVNLGLINWYISQRGICEHSDQRHQKEKCLRLNCDEIIAVDF